MTDRSVIVNGRNERKTFTSLLSEAMNRPFASEGGVIRPEQIAVS